MKNLGLKEGAKNQILLLLLIWTLIFSMPLLSGDLENGINWNHTNRIWRETALVFIVFLINRFILLPRLLLKDKRIVYLITVTFVIVIMSSFVFIPHQRLFKSRDFPESPNRNFADEMDYLQKKPAEKYSNSDMMPPKPIPNSEFAKPPSIPFKDMPPLKPNSKGPIPPFSNVFIMSLLIVGFDTGLIFFSRWAKTEQKNLTIEKEKIETQLLLLKNQVSPHFFMNTLNNIHALVDIDTEEAKESIIRLSELMDYMLYESECQHVSLFKEFEFVKSYVELMKLRFTEDVEIILNIPEFIPNVSVPPLLTISFIENAFKYGIDSEKKSFIHIDFDVNKQKLFFKVENTLHNSADGTKRNGIGINNVRKRLELIYGKNYQLNLNNRGDKFEVNLKIPL